MLLLLALAMAATSRLAPAAEVPGPAPAAQEPKSILLLYSAGFYLPAYRKNIAAFFAGMEAARFPVDRLHFEHLDLIRHGDPAYRRQVLDLLRSKYAGQKIDLIITVEGLARDLILNDGRDFLPDAPLLAILSADALDAVHAPRQVVQIPSVLDMAGTLQLGLSLFPETKRVFVVLGNGEDEQRWERDARIKFAPWAGKLEFEYSSDLTYQETLQRIGSLPPDTMVIYIALYKDKTGRAFVPRDAALALTKKSNAPVFGAYDEITPLLVGGSMISYGAEGARAAELALEILSGKFPLTQSLATLPILTRPNFNWQQLERWGVSHQALPKGSIVINRPSSIWHDYREYVVGGAVLIALQAGMILALLAMRRRSRKAEERYRRIVDTANEGICTGDSSYHIDFVNQKMADMLGYAPEEMLGKKVDDFLHPSELESQRSSAEKRRQGHTETYERLWLRKDGRPIWFLVSASPVFDEQKRFAGSFGMFTDITARKRAEEDLKESETKLRLIFNNSHDAIGVSLRGIQKWLNPAYLKLFGYSSREELVDKPILEVIAPGSRDDIAEKVRRRAERQEVPSSYETRGLRKDGSEFEMEVDASSYELQGETYTLVIIRDVTARKRAEEELWEALNFNQSIISGAPAGIGLYREDGSCVIANQYLADTAGGSVAQVLQQNFRQLDSWKASGMLAAAQLALETGEPQRIKVTSISSFGKKIWLDGRFLRLTLAGGPHLLFIVQDVTQQVRDEEEHKRLQAQLHQAQKMEAIGTLAGGIAHDFNNILGAILGFAEIAYDDAGSGQAKPADLEQIIASAQRAKDLVQQILSFSRKNVPDLQPLDLNQIVAQTQTILERTLPKMISIQTHLAAGLPRIQADPTQMEQVLLNLATNAQDAMPEGGKLILETQAATLDHEYCRWHLEVRPGRYVLLSVTDTGQGMDKDTLEHIFEPFFTTKDIGRGTGLGLSSVYGIVKSHGGHIHCYSEVITGTNFKIYLPVFAERASGPPREPNPADEASLAGAETILLVDDEQALRTIGARTLEDKGYRVLTAGSGEEALEIYRQKGAQLDLLIMDLGMPGMGGYKCLKAILAIDPGAKVIIASGYSANGQVKDALETGAAGYVGKPFRRVDLLTTVRSVLDKK